MLYHTLLYIYPLSSYMALLPIGGWVLVAIILVILLFLFIRHQRLLSLRAHLMREALHNHDFTFRLPTDRLFPGERDLQEALNDMGSEINRLLARSEVESWQRLTRVLTHEIMNAVAPISSITQAYISSPLVKGTPLEEGMQAIRDTSVNLQTFVESYRKLTQLQAPHIEEVSIDGLIRSLRTLSPSIVWHVNIGNSQERVSADSGMLRQVMVNITKNAIEAGARNIDLRLDYDDTRTLLLVSNDAPHIPPKEAREIFVPFITTNPSGTGIGLPLSRQMMLAQEGDLWLAETPVAGFHTTFVVAANTYGS